MAGDVATRRGGNGSWPQFPPGYAGQVVHGASTARLVNPLAEIICREYMDDPNMPEYLRRPMFVGALVALCEAEAQTYLFGVWMEGLPDGAKYMAKGAQQPPIERWSKLQERVANRRRDCGLTPLTQARIGKALASQALDIARIVAEAQRSGNWGDDDDQGDGS